MRLMNWNIEHMNSWWEGGDADPPLMRPAFAGNNFSPAITDVPALAQRVANVIIAVDPDVVTIQEGAGLPEMRDFFRRFVGGDQWKILRGAGGGQALVMAARLDRDVNALNPGPQMAGEVDLLQPFSADIDADLDVDRVEFARQPQVVTLQAHGQTILVLNNHLKSKYVRNAEAMFNAGGDQRLAFFAEALKARRRISGEAFRIRAYLDAALIENPEAFIMVTGDLNDGAGVDYFETHFLTHSVVDRIFGSIFHRGRQLVHVLFHGDSTDYTARFYDFITDSERELVLDHIGLSPALNLNWNWQGRVARVEYEAQIVDHPDLRERDRLPSDHRPVVVDLAPI